VTSETSFKSSDRQRYRASLKDIYPVVYKGHERYHSLASTTPKATVSSITFDYKYQFIELFYEVNHLPAVEIKRARKSRNQDCNSEDLPGSHSLAIEWNVQ
jgi:hypothetical protein